ncbi:MAG: hypothetical protein HYZ74_01570 [Elusimicrobia bacterium]|nr:hypothetical protein [Elusimicrobiota bacterium]
MDQQPKIPTLKDTQKPQVKIKGLGAGLTLFDRLKQFKKKDLAFILAGLGTLFMAPLAEHFMMSPENGDGQLQQGWGKGGGASGAGIFGSGGSPYENGSNGIASGGAIGGAGDIITPLNVRDPSSLIMGPGQAQQPPAGSATPPTAPTAPSRSDSDLKDALAGAASRAASAAVKRAPLPVPKVALGGSGLRGLGVAGGGTSASGSLGPISSGPGGSAGAGGGGLNLVRANPNFRGVAGPRGSGNPTGLDGTRKAGQNAADAFSRAGSALSALNEAAKEQIPAGGSGFGGGGQGGGGANDKFPGGSGPGGSKSVGESLAFIAAKERMMKNLEIEFEKKKLKDPELLLYKIRNDLVTSIATEGIGKPMGKFVGDMFGMLTPAASNPTLNCAPALNLSLPKSVADGNLCGDKPIYPCFIQKGSDYYYVASSNGPNQLCVMSGGDKEKKGPPPVSAISEMEGLMTFREVCGEIDKIKVDETGKPLDTKNKIDGYATSTLKNAANRADVGKVILDGGEVKCTGPLTNDSKDNVYSLIGQAKQELSSAGVKAGDGSGRVDGVGGLDQMGERVSDVDEKHIDNLLVSFTEAKKKLADAKQLIYKAKGIVSTPLTAPTKEQTGGSTDEKVDDRVDRVGKALGGVTKRAEWLEKAVANLEIVIDGAQTDLAQPDKTGSLYGTVGLNKALDDLKKPTRPALPKLSASSIKGDQDKAAAELKKADDSLAQMDASDPGKPEYDAAKKEFDTQLPKVEESVKAVQAKQKESIIAHKKNIDDVTVETTK